MMNSINPQTRDDYGSYFRDIFKAQRSELNYPSSHNQKMEEAGF